MTFRLAFAITPLSLVSGRRSHISSHQQLRMSLPRCTQPPTGRAAENSALLRSHVPRLETSRLRLRCAETKDFPAWAEIFGANESEKIGGPMTSEQAWSSFTDYIANWLLHGHGLFSVERKDNQQLVGFTLIGLEWDDYEPELGWLFTKKGQGHGYATEAASAACTYAQELLGPKKFVSYIDATNSPSIRLAKRLHAERDLDAEQVTAADGDPVQVWRHVSPNKIARNS